MRERLWVALDVETLEEADGLLERLAGAAIGAKIGAQLFTAAGPAAVETALKRGFPMMRAAAEAATTAAKDFGVPRPVCLGVTVLTSLDRKGLDEVGVSGNVEAHVLCLAERAREGGLEGCVASPQEIALLRRALGRTWVIVTPGIRTNGSRNDQRRIATPAAAIRAGVA